MASRLFSRHFWRALIESSSARPLSSVADRLIPASRAAVSRSARTLTLVARLAVWAAERRGIDCGLRLRVIIPQRNAHAKCAFKRDERATGAPHPCIFALTHRIDAGRWLACARRLALVAGIHELDRRALGTRAEERAARLLERAGFCVLLRN